MLVAMDTLPNDETLIRARIHIQQESETIATLFRCKLLTAEEARQNLVALYEQYQPIWWAIVPSYPRFYE